MTGVALIEAGPAHGEVVAALHGATIGDAGDGNGAWSGEWVARILALPGAYAVLAAAPEPIGFALCLPAGDAVDLVAIGVAPARRRAGIGRMLMDECARRARAAGASRLMLEAAADNTSAIAFYRGIGFAVAGRRAGYYRARPGEAPRDALILSKVL